MAFRFSIVSDVREVLRGNEAMEKGFDETADSLDELARAAQKNGDKVSRELDGVGDDASDAGEKIEKKFRDAFRQVEDGAKDAGREVGTKLKDGGRDAEQAADKVGDAFKDAGDEVGQSARESAASFSGEITDVADLAQETLANAFASFGPVGAAAGIAAAAGLGTLWTNITDGSEKSKQAVASMYEDMLASGADFLSRDAIQERISAIVTGAEEAVVSYKSIQGQAEISGASVQDLLLAWSGDQDAINRVLDTTNRKLDETSQKFRDGKIANDEYTGTRYQLTDLQDRISAVSENLGIAADGARTTREAMNRLSQTRVDIPIDANPDQAYAQLDNLGRVIGSQHPVIPVSVDTTKAERDILSLLRPRSLPINYVERRGTSVP